MSAQDEFSSSKTQGATSNLSDKGRFQVTNRLVLSIAIPMSFGYLTTPLLGVVDTAVIGQLGVPALIGGLAVGTVLVDIFLFSFNFLRSGTVGLTAQAYGAGNETEIKACLLRALGLAALIGILLILVTPLLLAIGLWFMQPGEEIAKATDIYFSIRMLSAPFALANYVLFGWLVGCGSTRLALLLQVLLNSINIILSVLFVLGLNMGIEGVGWATVIAELAACLIGLLLAWRILRGHEMPSLAQLGDVAAVKRMMSMNGDIMIRSFALLFAFGYFTSQGAGYGEVVLASNAILMHFFLVSGYFLDGLAVAAEQLSGRAIGARDQNAFLRSVKLTTLWSFALALFLAVVYLAVGEFIIDKMTTSLEVRAVAKQYFWWAAFISFAGVGAFVMDGVYIGSTWSRHMSITMVASLLGFIACWWLLKPHFGNDGLWLSLYAFLLLRGLTLAALLPYNYKNSFGQNEFSRALLHS